MEVQMMPSQPVGQPSFFYYNPDLSSDHRQHGHFSQHPSAGHEDALVLNNPSQYYQPAMMHRPPPMMYPPGPQKPALLSPQPIHQAASVLSSSELTPLSLNTQCGQPDVGLNPATPGLSAGGSGSTSPPSTCGILPTPTGTYLGSSILEGVKQGCEGDVKNEILAGGDFTRACSPPLTPVFIHPPSLTASQATDLLSINSCPSLSPSPSPGPQSVTSDTETNFCNPRNLLVSATHNAQPVLDHFPLLPTLCSGDDEEHKLILGGDFTHKIPDSCGLRAFDTTFNGPPNFDTLSDLDSENEFVTDLTRGTAESFYLGNKRRRLDLAPIDDDSLLSEDSFDDFEDSEQFASAGFLTPPESEMEPVESPPKSKSPKKARSPLKKAKKSPGRAGSTDSNPQNTEAADESADNKDESAQGSVVGSAGNNTTTPNTPASATSNNPIARRGRKQSLTDDPSKTFVCTLCSRRFRRQEHLKRHYRSLHTHDKPFKCGECGKQFSRSDNLSQHARTHGAGAITLDILEEGELPQDIGDGVDQTEILGARLYEAAAAAAGSTSGSSSPSSIVSRQDSTSPAPQSETTKSMRKRKRED